MCTDVTCAIVFQIVSFFLPSMASAPNPMNKQLWIQLNKVKNDGIQKGQFIYETSSFEHPQEDTSGQPQQNLIVGQLYLTSNIYKNYALRIEIHLPLGYPLQAPEVIIATPIYHPNVNENSE